MQQHIDDNLEKILWEAADMLRGNMDASEYKQVFLGLIFLKHISEKFESKYRQLKEEGGGFEDNIDEYISCGVYFIPPDAGWGEIIKRCGSNDIGEYIDNAIRDIEKANPSLQGVLPKYYSRAELDKERLAGLIRLFNEKINTETANNTLGRIYEYCLRRFAEGEGRRAGEFYTPASVVKTMIKSLNPRHGRLYDPCCGSGGVFICTEKYIKEQNGDRGDISYYGQDSNPTTWKMCMMNLAIHGIEADIGKHNADTFLQDLHPTLAADFVLASPPFNMSEWGAQRLWNDIRWKYGMPPAGNANYAWMQHMIYHLAPKGRMCIVLSNGSLTSQTGGEMDIRKNLVEKDLIECILAMPSNLFYNTSIPVSIWFINKAKSTGQQGKILFLDATGMGWGGRSQKELREEEICKISEKIRAYRGEAALPPYENEAGFCAAADIDLVREYKYALLPGRYVGISDPTKDIEDNKKSMRELTKDLKNLMHENHRLERELEKKLGVLGYDI